MNTELNQFITKSRFALNSNYTDEISNALIQSIRAQIDHHLILALEKIGHKFENETDLINFIKKNCTCEEYENKQIYKANGVIFAVYEKESILKLDNITELKINMGGIYY